MKKKYLDQWVTDLLSDEFKQGKAKLVRIGTKDGIDFGREHLTTGQKFHCCMGVLCESVQKLGFEFKEVEEYRAVIFYDDEDAFPPERLANEVGMGSVDGLFAGKGARWVIEFPEDFGPGRRIKTWNPDGHQTADIWVPDTETTVGFAGMNDCWKFTFSQIADMIKYFIPVDPDDEPAKMAEESNQS